MNLKASSNGGQLTGKKQRISSKENWPAGITRLLVEARTDVNQLHSHVRIERAIDLSRRTGMSFDATYNPMYFTGAFESPIVLVHLNPKLSELLAKHPYTNFDDYCIRHRAFGFVHWGLDPFYYSAFDLKQVRFIRPFGVIEFRPETEIGHLRTNAAMVCDLKFQLELIPYASPSFETAKFSSDVLESHFARILAAIAAYPRKYVIFCGAVFDDLLERSGYLTFRKDHRFHLAKKGGGQGKPLYQFSNVRFSFEGKSVQAGVARSFAIQGIPMDAYGFECSKLYGMDGEI